MSKKTEPETQVKIMEKQIAGMHGDQKQTCKSVLKAVRQIDRLAKDYKKLTG